MVDIFDCLKLSGICWYFLFLRVILLVRILSVSYIVFEWVVVFVCCFNYLNKGVRLLC